VVCDTYPGDKHAHSQPYPRTRYQTSRAYRHNSFIDPAGVRNSGFFDEAEDQEDQQGRRLNNVSKMRLRPRP
jgi:hypothetical protein